MLTTPSKLANLKVILEQLGLSGSWPNGSASFLICVPISILPPHTCLSMPCFQQEINALFQLRNHPRVCPYNRKHKTSISDLSSLKSTLILHPCTFFSNFKIIAQNLAHLSCDVNKTILLRR